MKSDPSVPKTTTIKISAIVVDPDARPDGLDDARVAELEAAYRDGKDVPPPVVWNTGKVFRLSRGFHRVEAAKRAGLKELAFVVMTGTPADATRPDRGRETERADDATGYDFHPVCLAFPRMDDAAFAKRRADYAAHPERARQSAVELTPDDDDGGTLKICDGRHHYLICQELGYEFTTLEIRHDTRAELCAYVESRNHNRRHMTASQIAASIVALNTFQNGGDRGNQHTGGRVQRCTLPTQQEAADAAGIGVRTLKSATKAAKDAPELVPAMRDGKLDAHTASKVADLPKRDRAKIIAAENPKAAAKAKLAAAKPAPAEPVKLPDAAPTPAEQPSTGDTADEVEEAPVVVEAEAAPAEPAKPVTPPKADPFATLIDPLGQSIPRGVRDTFGDPAMKNAVERIRAVHAEIISIANHVKGPLARKGHFWPFASCAHSAESLLTAADKAAVAMSQIEGGLPYCVCVKCKGDGCHHCLQSGCLPKWKYDNRATYGV